MSPGEQTWTGGLIASAVIPLLVALLNLLVAGYALTAGFRERRKLAFAAGPAGVGLWALAWFVSVFNPSTLGPMRVLGAAGGLLAMSGYTVDALLDLDRRRARRWAGLWAGLALAATASVFLLLETELGRHYETQLAATFARALAVAAVPVLVLARLSQKGGAEGPLLGVIRWSLWSAAITGLAFALFTAAAVAGARTLVDPILYVVLLAELLALAYIVHRRIDVHVLLSRAVTYSGLAIIVAGVTALIFSQLGYEVDVVVVTVTVAVSLMATALFMALSDPITRQVARMLFPKHARMEAALSTSRGELSALRRRLERAEKLAIAGELAASVAHEIKNPLAPIRGYAQLLEGKLQQLPEERREVFEKGLRIIREETERIDGRVHALLDIARADRGRPSIEESFDLNRVVIEAALVAEAEPGLEHVLRDLDPEIGFVAGNADEMRGALSNLMKNAAEAMQDGGGSTLSVTTRREGDRVVVEVADDGPGIEQAAVERVFEAFYTTKEGGTGLGLAIARSAVEAAGGTLTIGPRTGARGTVARMALLSREPSSTEPSAETELSTKGAC